MREGTGPGPPPLRMLPCIQGPGGPFEEEGAAGGAHSGTHRGGSMEWREGGGPGKRPGRGGVRAALEMEGVPI